MLFLAVFCGFLAENQREHMVEHQREKQFVKSLIVDIQNDVKLIDQQNAFNKEKIEKQTVLLKCLMIPQPLQHIVMSYII